MTRLQESLDGERGCEHDKQRTGSAFSAPLIPFAEACAECQSHESECGSGDRTMISSGKSGISTAGSAIPTPSESRLIDSEVMSKPAPRVAVESWLGGVPKRISNHHAADRCEQG
jgi:hypothetical protein